MSKIKTTETISIVLTIYNRYNCHKKKERVFYLEVEQMTAKEELKQLILSLTPEEIDKACAIFQDHFLKKREAQQLHSQKDPLLNQSKLA